MAHFPDYAKRYMLIGLTATPDVLEALVERIPANDPVWSYTPDPERFTLRAIIAHLADWDGIFLERIIKTRDENEPHIEDLDEGQVAIDNDYANSDPFESLRRFRATREILVQTLRDMDPAHWNKVAHRHFGPITALHQAVLVLGHDGYHTQQVTQWLEAAGK